MESGESRGMHHEFKRGVPMQLEPVVIKIIQFSSSCHNSNKSIDNSSIKDRMQDSYTSNANSGVTVGGTGSNYSRDVLIQLTNTRAWMRGISNSLLDPYTEYMI